MSIKLRMVYIVVNFETKETIIITVSKIYKVPTYIFL